MAIEPLQEFFTDNQVAAALCMKLPSLRNKIYREKMGAAIDLPASIEAGARGRLWERAVIRSYLTARIGNQASVDERMSMGAAAPMTATKPEGKKNTSSAGLHARDAAQTKPL